MKYQHLLSVILIMGIALLCAGCSSPPQSAQEKTMTPGEEKTPIPDTVKENRTADPADTDRYYYNIRIVPPSSLENLEKEIGPDEYLIRNENGDRIGIVSPRFLYIRGDLVQLQQERESGSGGEFDKTDIARHLVDIAFGFDNSRLTLFKSDKDYKFWFDAYYTREDLETAREFAKTFNSLSESTQFEDEEVVLGFLMSNYADIPYNFYNIRIMPDKMLEDFKDDRSDTDRLLKSADGTLIGIIGSDHLYLLDSLTEEERRFYIKKGVLYSMGLHGTSFTSRESFFYREDQLNQELSDLDREAIRLLYGGRLRTGMDLEETRKTLGLIT